MTKKEALEFAEKLGVLDNQINFIRAGYDKYIRTIAEKDRSVDPWNKHEYSFLWGRLNDEMIELAAELPIISGGSADNIMAECLDIGQFLFFIYEKARLSKEPAND